MASRARNLCGGCKINQCVAGPAGGTLTCCCCRRRDPGSDKHAASTPLPWSKLIVLCAVLFVTQFGINMIFPFLPFMVHDFFPYLDKTELGRKAGYLGGAYFFGNFVGSFVWGVASDKLGRRTVMLMGVCFTIACELLFGFSQNMLWAVFARCLWGSLNGNIGVAKTYISEICDDTNQAKGFAAVGTTGGIGRLMGSVIGGFLAQPANKYPLLQFQLFCDYPYSLPCIVGAGISVFSLVAAWLFLDETLQKKKVKTTSSSSSSSIDNSSGSSEGQGMTDSGIELLQPGSNSSDTISSIRSQGYGEMDFDEEDGEHSDLFETDLDTDSDYDANSDTELLENLRKRTKYSGFCSRVRKYKDSCLRVLSFAWLGRKVKQRVTECIRGFMLCAVGIWEFNYSKCRTLNVKSSLPTKWQTASRGALRTLLLLRDRKVCISIALYGVIAFLSIIMNELFPLLLVTTHDYGGYHMDASEIGVILSVSAVMQLLFQFFAFPRVAKCLGYRHTFKLGTVLFGISCILLPFSNQISGPISSISDEVQTLSSSNGSGSGSGMFVIPDNSTPFCGASIYDDNTTEVIGNSVTRVPARVWLVIMTISTIQILARVISITSVMVLISNSSLPETRGTVNGYGQSVAALGRMVGPMAGAPMFAWSETLKKHWPLNYHLVFDLLAVGTVGAFVLALLLPRSIEQKREIPPSVSMTAVVSEDDIEQTSSSVQLVSIHVVPELNSGDTEDDSLNENQTTPNRN